MVTFNLLGKQGKNPYVWYEVDGYITTVSELAVIFNIHPGTLRQRLRYGWDIVPAVLVANTVKLTFKEVTLLTEDPTLEPKFRARLQSYFGRPSFSNFGG